nr:protein kinase [Clostridium pasteurianum]
MSEFLKEGQLFDEKYKIIKQIGKGGMSIVYLAENIRLGTKWAIKVARKDMGEKVDLLAEPNILKNLKHEALPRIIDIISNDNRIYIVEDYIEGTPLNVELKNQEKFSEKIVVEWAKQICNVLEYLHKQKPNPIIYRDMKPSNIILSKISTLSL